MQFRFGITLSLVTVSAVVSILAAQTVFSHQERGPAEAYQQYLAKVDRWSHPPKESPYEGIGATRGEADLVAIYHAGERGPWQKKYFAIGLRTLPPGLSPDAKFFPELTPRQLAQYAEYKEGGHYRPIIVYGFRVATEGGDSPSFEVDQLTVLNEGFHPSIEELQYAEGKLTPSSVFDIVLGEQEEAHSPKSLSFRRSYAILSAWRAAVARKEKNLEPNYTMSPVLFFRMERDSIDPPVRLQIWLTPGTWKPPARYLGDRELTRMKRMWNEFVQGQSCQVQLSGKAMKAAG